MMKSIKRVIKQIFLILILLAAIACSALVIEGYTLYRESVTEMDIAQKIEEIRGKENYTQLRELSEHYINAVIAIEDHRFYSHGAIDFISIGRAILTNIKELDFATGGSTITQQLAKNVFFTQEKTIKRKIAEMFMAYDLEARYSKDEVLELYINTNYFGNGYYGIREAAIGYYEKLPSELDLYESAMLAGIPNAPSVYALDKNPELAKQRQNQVIAQMVKHDYLTQNEVDAASQ